MKRILKEYKAINYIFGALFSLSIVFGFYCEYFGEINLKNPKTYLFLVLIFIIATAFSKVFWDIIKDRKLSVRDESKDKQDTVKVWLLSTLIIWIAYFIVFVGVYPGFFVYDAQEELMEVVTRTFNNQYPMLHVLSLGGVIQAVHKLTGEYNISIAVFILFQMSLIALSLGFLIKTLYKDGISKLGAIIFSIYIGFFPVLSMYALCSSKDGVFGAALLITVIYLRKIYTNPSKHDYVILSIASILMMLLRSNGAYAFVVFVVIELVTKAIIKDKKLLLSSIVSIAVFFVINTGLLTLTDASSVGHREILTVPIQQLARVCSYDEASLSADELLSVYNYIPEEAVKRYNPKCSDLVKIAFNEEAYSKDKSTFWKTWFRVGINHPVAYLNALCMTSYGLWYPQATIDGYRGNQMFTYTYGDSSYFGYEVEPPGIRDSKISVIDRLFRFLSLDITIHRIPIVRFIFSPGFLLWAYIFIIGYFIYTSNASYALSYALPLVAVLTCFIGPMSLVRYAFYLWIFVPMGIADIIINKRKAAYSINA